MTPTRILIVGGEEAVALSMQRKLEALDYTVIGTVATARAAIESATEEQPDLILMDDILHGQLDHTTLAAFIQERFDIPIIYLTTISDEATVKQDQLNAPYGYLLKSFEGIELQTAIEVGLYKHQMTRQLQEQEQWLSTVLKSIDDAVVATDDQGQISFMNLGAEKLTGWATLFAIGKPLMEVFQIIDERTQQPLHNLFDQIMNRQQTVILDSYSILVRRDGETVYVEGSVAPIRGHHSEVTGIVLAVHDVSEKRRAEKAFRESEEKYRLLFENSPESIALVALDGTILDCNEAMLRFRNQPKHKIVGRHFLEFSKLDEGALGSTDELFHHLLQGNAVGPVKTEFADVEPKARWLELFPAAWQRDGQVEGVQIIARDITQRILAEEEVAHYHAHLEELIEDRTVELEQSNRQLARSNAELEQFAYVASHDLREPLRKIKGYTELLARRYEGQLDEKSDKYIHYIVDGTNRMQQLIAELLAYSAIGQSHLKLKPVALPFIFDDVISDLELVIHENKATVTTDALPTAMVDTHQFSRLLSNLLRNALKFRGDAPPQIHLSAQEKPSEWVFGVSDNGIGIDPKDFKRIFYIFHRLHGRAVYEGHGMGLAICKKIVENHQGRIWVESQVNEGTTFYFSIPKL